MTATCQKPQSKPISSRRSSLFAVRCSRRILLNYSAARVAIHLHFSHLAPALPRSLFLSVSVLSRLCHFGACEICMPLIAGTIYIA